MLRHLCPPGLPLVAVIRRLSGAGRQHHPEAGIAEEHPCPVHPKWPNSSVGGRELIAPIPRQLAEDDHSGNVERRGPAINRCRQTPDRATWACALRQVVFECSVVLAVAVTTAVT